MDGDGETNSMLTVNKVHILASSVFFFLEWVGSCPLAVLPGSYATQRKEWSEKSREVKNSPITLILSSFVCLLAWVSI